MSLKVVLFDLDATLLPMDQDAFIAGYFKLLAKKLVPHGYEADALIRGMWRAVNAMIENNGTRLNKDVFWETFSKECGQRVFDDEPILDEFYRENFCELKTFCGYNPDAAKTVRALKEKGIVTVLATNPVYPFIATNQRLEWAGLKATDFEIITTYENASFCKPNIKYYSEILSKINCAPENTLMVGNDVTEDMVAQNIGIKVFLLTDYLINKSNVDINIYSHGSFKELEKYIDKIL